MDLPKLEDIKSYSYRDHVHDTSEEINLISKYTNACCDSLKNCCAKLCCCFPKKTIEIPSKPPRMIRALSVTDK